MSLFADVFRINGIVNLTSLIVKRTEVALGYAVFRLQYFIWLYEHSISILLPIWHPSYLFPEVGGVVVIRIQLVVIFFVFHQVHLVDDTRSHQSLVEGREGMVGVFGVVAHHISNVAV